MWWIDFWPSNELLKNLDTSISDATIFNWSRRKRGSPSCKHSSFQTALLQKALFPLHFFLSHCTVSLQNLIRKPYARAVSLARRRTPSSITMKQVFEDVFYILTVMPFLKVISGHSLTVVFSWINFYVIIIQATEAPVFPCVISAADILSNYVEALSWIDTRFKSNGGRGRSANSAELYVNRSLPGLYWHITIEITHEMKHKRSCTGAYVWYVRRTKTIDRSDIYTKVGPPRWDALGNFLIINSRTNENVVLLARLYNGALVRSSIVTLKPADYEHTPTKNGSMMPASLSILDRDLSMYAEASYKRNKSKRQVHKENLMRQEHTIRMKEALMSAMRQQAIT